MLYTLARIIFWGITLLIVLIIIKKAKKISKKKVIITIISCIILCFISGLFPIENLFIDFQSPEDVFNYTSTGEIIDIIYGNDSCMIYYSTGPNSFSYLFVKKSENGYKISSNFSTKIVSKKFDQNGSFDVYNLSETNDYYIIGTINSEENTINIFNDKDEKVECEIKRVEDTGFIYCYIKDYTDRYYIIINGNKSFISN